MLRSSQGEGTAEVLPFSTYVGSANYHSGRKLNKRARHTLKHLCAHICIIILVILNENKQFLWCTELVPGELSLGPIYRFDRNKFSDFYFYQSNTRRKAKIDRFNIYVRFTCYVSALKNVEC